MKQNPNRRHRILTAMFAVCVIGYIIFYVITPLLTAVGILTYDQLLIYLKIQSLMYLAIVIFCVIIAIFTGGNEE